MKKIFAATVLIFSVLSVLFYTENASASKGIYWASVTINNISGTKNNMTFDYTFTGYNGGNIYSVQVCNSSGFTGTVVQANLTSSTQTSGVDCSELSSGTAYCRIMEGATVISTSPVVKAFTLP